MSARTSIENLISVDLILWYLNNHFASLKKNISDVSENSCE